MFTQLAKQLDPAAFHERQERILDFLRQRAVGVLATVDASGDPHATVIYYSVDDSGNIFFITKRQTQKYQNLSRHNRAVLVAFDEATQTTTQVMGTVNEVNDVASSQSIFSDVLRVAVRHSNGVIPISRLVAGEYVTYKLKPTRIRMAMYSRPNGGSAENIFEVLEAYELDISD